MENRVFVLFFVIAVLSFVFFGVSVLILRLRSKYGLRILPILWVIAFLSATIPITSGQNIAELDLFKNYTGGIRIEMHRAAEEPPEADVPEIYINYNALQVMRGICYAGLTAWFLFATASFTFGLASYFDGIHYLTKNSTVCHDERIEAIFDSARRKAGVKRKITLRIMKSQLRISPCTCGILFPSVYIGGDYLKDYSELWLQLVFMHELTHIKHRDTLTKFITLAATSFHGMLPMSRTIRGAVCEDIEYLCDEAVLDKMGDSIRSEYISMIIDVAERNLREDCRGTEILSCVSQSGNAIIRRYNNMKERHDKRRNIVRAVPALIVGVLVNMAAMSVVGIKSIDNPGVDLANPFVEAAVCEYFGVDDPHELTENHLNQIYSIEFSLSDYREFPEVEVPGRYALACTLNEGFLWNGIECVPMIHPDNNSRYSYELLPRVIRADRFEKRLPNDENSARMIRSFYKIYEEADEAIYILDPQISEHEASEIVNLQYQSGLINLFLTDTREVDTRDLSLFSNLRTVIFSDKTTSSDEAIYESTVFAVIRRED